MGLEVATYISELVTTNPINSDTKSQGDDHLRLIKAALQATFPGADLPFYLSTDRTDVASATTTDLGAVVSQWANITGTTTITGFGTCNAGTWRFIRFNGALILTHNASSLILPTAANITTVAGDQAIAISRGSGNWTVVAYFRAAGTALAAVGATTSLAGAVELAIQAEVAAATDAARVAALDMLKYHPGIAKAHASFTCSTGALLKSHGVSGVVRNSAGVYTVTLSVTMDSISYSVIPAVEHGGGGTSDRLQVRVDNGTPKTSTTFKLHVTESDANNFVDPERVNFAVFGVLA